MRILLPILLLTACGELVSDKEDNEGIDKDGDGIFQESDCDDTNPDLGNTELDIDCDGVTSDLDCDDENDLVTNTNELDADCDLVSTDIDCDDSDGLVTIQWVGRRLWSRIYQYWLWW